MEIASLHNGTLPRERFGIRAHRLSQAASIGAPVPPAIVLADALKAIADMRIFKSTLQGILEPGQLYALRASPGQPDWGGPHTYLALGMNDAVYKRLLEEGDRAAASEVYRQAIVTYGIAVKGLDAEPFETLLNQYGGYKKEVAFETMQSLLNATRELFKEETGEDFTQDPIEQFAGAVESMAKQWQSPTAKILRKAKGASDDAHLALILQEMKHGLGPNNGVGRVQSMNAQTGKDEIEGIFVEATLTAAGAPPQSQWPIAKIDGKPSFEKFSPTMYAEMLHWQNSLIAEIHDHIEMKFVIDGSCFYVTEVLIARRTQRASLAMLMNLVDRKVLTEEEVILRVDPMMIASFLHKQIDPDAPRHIISEAVAASPGAASGEVVFSSMVAIQKNAQGSNVILVRDETSPDDVRGMSAASAILTMRGGMTSHAAVIARGLGVPCVVGARKLHIDRERECLVAPDGIEINEGDQLTIDGTTGEVVLGSPKMIEPSADERIDQLLVWANERRQLKVRVNADTPEDARRSLDFGADGIGLCRTEHMFFSESRLRIMRKLILAETREERIELLKELRGVQEADFIELFELMKGKPVTIRLLDPPLHEFLPKHDADIARVALDLGVDEKTLRARIATLHEFNPMLGMRGVRLGIMMPEIYEMQVRAIFAAAAEVNKNLEDPVIPEIMAPLISSNREVEIVKSRIDAIAEKIAQKTGKTPVFRFGVMIETPRAALRAGDFANISDFFSMGTNDLTQMTYGLSRDDAGRFMRDYVAQKMFVEDPFLTLDQEGVGELIKEATNRGRENNPDLVVGLCGEHGGDPDSVEFSAALGFDYVSCSPYRVPIAQIAAAKAFIKSKLI